MIFVIGNLVVMFSAQMTDFICRLFNVFRSFVWAIIPEIRVIPVKLALFFARL